MARKKASGPSEVGKFLGTGELSHKANWLGRYLAVERGYDKSLIAILKDAAEDAHSKLVELPDKDNISTAERRARYRQANKELNAVLTDTFGKVGATIKPARKTAAVAAADARVYEDRKFLERMFPDPVARESYAKSLRQTAQRNVEAVMTRQIETKMPLSKQVYKTKQLSKGYVDRAINRALARGDGAKEIADLVRDMIRPDVRGGVSYAAMRLGRSEVHRAYFAQARHDIEDNPWATKAEWQLSKVHEEIGCACEEYADIRYFDKHDIPDPPHPQCRCYITAVQMEWDDFEKALLAGEFDAKPEEAKSFGPLKSAHRQAVVDAMKAVEPQEKTTKAAQPKGWTGPLVAKAAANKVVRNVTDEMWLSRIENTANLLYAARYGSRLIQTKGYRGGLSSAGKKAILAGENSLNVTEAMATDIGRELTARTAYAAPSTQMYYRAMQFTEEDLAKLRKTPDVSLPLSTFNKNPLETFEHLGYSSAQGARTAMIELETGAKVADVGGSHVALGQFKITRMTTKEINGEQMSVIRVKQVDSREFEAAMAKGDPIPDLSIVPEAGKIAVPKQELPEPPKPKVSAIPRVTATMLQPHKFDKAATLEAIHAADTPESVGTVLRQTFPQTQFNGFRAGDTTMDTAVGAARALVDVMDQFPSIAIERYGSVAFPDSRVTTRGALSSNNVFAVTPSRFHKTVGVGFDGADREFFIPKSDVELNKLFWSNNTKIKESYEHSVKTKFHPTVGHKEWQRITAEDGSYAVSLHELGHVIAFSTGDTSRMYSEMTSAVKAEYKKAAGIKGRETFTDTFEYRDWLTKNMSHYGSKDVIDKKGNKVIAKNSTVFAQRTFDPEEALAEAVADVIANGGTPQFALSNVLWKILLKYTKPENLKLMQNTGLRVSRKEVMELNA